MASSDFSSTYMLGVRLVAFPSRPGTRVRAWMRPPRFRAKNFSTCTRSPTARGSSHASHSPWDDVAFSSTERDRHLGIRPVSQLNTWPVVSPVNASRRPSRDAAHHSGSGRMASPYPMGDFHLLFFASFPGALRIGSNSEVAAIPSYFCFAPMNGHRETQRPSPFGANRRLMRRSKQLVYSITSSARASSVGGTSMPSALAVLRLTPSSYLTGACTGRSAGFAPLKMRST
jgi:hypothetical protein